MALLEAMALGTPVVASAVGGVPEVVTDGATGVLVAPADARALADACVALVRDRPRSLALAGRAREVIEARFSHERNGERLVDLYRQVIARGSRGSLRSRVQERLALTTRLRMR
jgi:glycosyltransferase involved in cell wall biosynthesis